MNTRTGLSMKERFSSPTHHIYSQSYECSHGKHYEVVVECKRSGEKHIVHHCHNYRDHWQAMYEASERWVLEPETP